MKALRPHNQNFYILVFILVFAFAAKSYSQPEILAVLPHQFGANTHFNLDNLDEYGFDVTTAGINKLVDPCSWSASLGSTRFEVDLVIDDIVDISSFDAIVIMPMNWRSVPKPYGDLMDSGHFLQLLREARSSNKVIWASCAGVRVLAEAGVIDGVKVSGNANFSQEYINAGATFLGSEIMPVLDQNIITSTRGMYYMQENIEVIATALEKTGMDFASDQTGGELIDIIHDDLEIAAWSHQFSDEGSIGIRDLCRTSDGGFLSVGYTWAVKGNNSDILVIKTDYSGSREWSKSYGGSGWEYAWSVAGGAGDGYLIAGYSTSNDGSDKNMYVLKIDQNGDMIWDKQIGGAGLDVARDVVEDPNGNIYVVGYTESGGAGENDVLLAKLNPSGNLAWLKNYGGQGPETARSIIINEEGNLVIAGETGSSGTGNRDFWVACVNTDGGSIWERSYHKNNYDSGFQIVENPDNGYLVVGHGDTHGQDFLDLSLLRIDDAGEQVWLSFFKARTDFYDYGKSMAYSDNETFTICGVAKQKETRKNTLYLIMFDPDGRKLMDNYFDIGGSRWCTSVIPDVDNNFVVGGQVKNEEGTGAWLFKIHNPLVAGVSIKEIDEASNPSCYPNPFSSELNICAELMPGEKGSCRILDFRGRLVQVKRVGQKGLNCWKWVINPDTLGIETGIYFISWETNLRNQVQKVFLYR